MARASSASSSAFASSWSRPGMRRSGSSGRGQTWQASSTRRLRRAASASSVPGGQRPDRQEVDRLGETGRLTRHGRPQPPLSGFFSSYLRILL